MSIVQLGRLRSRLMVTHLSRQVVEPGLEPGQPRLLLPTHSLSKMWGGTV